MAPSRRRPGDPAPEYGPLEELFSVEIHHRGFFCGQGMNKSYVDGLIATFDRCEVDTWSPLWLNGFLEELGHDTCKAQIYWLLPGMNLDDGLRIMDRDADCLSMTAVVPKFQFFKLYVHHADLYNDLHSDDVCIIGSPSLPNVLSPQKSVISGQISMKSPRLKTMVTKGNLMHGQGGGSGRTSNNIGQKGRGCKRVAAAEDKESDTDDSDDSDYADWVDSDNDIDKDDDDLFLEWVDEEPQDIKAKKKKAREHGIDSDYDSDDLQLPASENEEDESEHEVVLEKGKKKKKKKVKLRTFKPKDMIAPTFQIGMVFPTAIDLRKAIQEYSIQNRVAIKYAKNDKQRIRAHCEENCPWYLFAAPDSRNQSFVVKTYVGTHTCSKEWELKAFTAKYLAARYIENFRADDKMTLRNFSRLVQQDYNMTVTRSKLQRARRIAMKLINGDEEKQYTMLWDYAEEIRRSNPGSSMFMELKDGTFYRFYMSLDACKRGFISGCRPVICIDGCHLKNKYGGQLLTAVGVDPNDCIFPIAIAVVEVEDTPTWKWFLQTLKEELNINNTAPWTIMSDRQKGLINAVSALFPDGEHRFCVRHLYQNFVKKFKGEKLKNKLWQIARSTTRADWTKHMDEMKALDNDAYLYLEAIEPSAWCRAFFRELPKCDLLLNNSCEVFNKYILDAREMPVLTMFQKIKNQLMTRFYGKDRECKEWCGRICPKIRKKLNKNAEMANNCYASAAGKRIFQVTGLVGKYIVDLNKSQCSCRAWQLTGIPCRHSISCARDERIKPEDLVSHCYSISAFKAAYGEIIMPCRDQREWTSMNGIIVKPPKYEKQVGRPSKKRKKSAVEEEEGRRMSRHGSVSHCSVCNSTEHNRRTCPELGKGQVQNDQAAGHQAQQKERRKLSVKRRIIANTQASSSTSLVASTVHDVSQQNLSVFHVLMQDAVGTQQSQAAPPPSLPENDFIARHRDALPWRSTKAITHVAGLKKKKKSKEKEKENVVPRKKN